MLLPASLSIGTPRSRAIIDQCGKSYRLNEASYALETITTAHCHGRLNPGQTALESLSLLSPTMAKLLSWFQLPSDNFTPWEEKARRSNGPLLHFLHWWYRTSAMLALKFVWQRLFSWFQLVCGLSKTRKWNMGAPAGFHESLPLVIDFYCQLPDMHWCRECARQVCNYSNSGSLSLPTLAKSAVCPVPIRYVHGIPQLHERSPPQPGCGKFVMWYILSGTQAPTLRTSKWMLSLQKRPYQATWFRLFRNKTPFSSSLACPKKQRPHALELE